MLVGPSFALLFHVFISRAGYFVLDRAWKDLSMLVSCKKPHYGRIHASPMKETRGPKIEFHPRSCFSRIDGELEVTP